MTEPKFTNGPWNRGYKGSLFPRVYDWVNLDDIKLGDLMDSEDVKFIGGFILSCILGLFLLVMGIQFINITFFDNIPSKVYVDNKLVYEGSSAGFNISSSGYATTVTIDEGFLYMFPKAVYTSKDVRVQGEK